MTRSRSIVTVFLLAALMLPFAVFAQATDSTPVNVGQLQVGTPVGNGIFNCNPIGAESVGSRSAIGGTYVPVSDAAVTLNTGYLVYKECLLRPLVNAQRETLTSAYVANMFELLAKGKNGNPLWPVDYRKDVAQVRDAEFVNTVKSELLSKINPSLKNEVTTAAVRNYQMTTQDPQNSLACPYEGDLRAAVRNPTQNYSPDVLFALADPNCNAVWLYYQVKDRVAANGAAAQDEWLNRLNWNNGIYDKRDANGNVTTPGIFLAAAGEQAVTSGFRQLENANDIGQMVRSMFAGLTSKLLSTSGGIPSILASNGPDSYLAQMMQQSQNGLLGNITTIALQNLYQILNWEQQYNDIQAQTANVLTTSINQIRGSENACWNLVIQKVCTGSASSTSCTSESGTALTIATSTQFSDAAIAKAGIGAAATALKQAVDASNQNIVTINSLIAAIQSSDANARNTALANLDTIVNANPPVLHTQSSITKVQDDLASVQAQMLGSQGGSVGFVKKTQQIWAGDAIDQYGSAVKSAIAWDGSIDPGTGWCNINKQSTLDQWAAKWSQ